MFKLLLFRIIIIIIIIICMTVFSNTCIGFRGFLPTVTYLGDEAKSSRPISVLGGNSRVKSSRDRYQVYIEGATAPLPWPYRCGSYV